MWYSSYSFVIFCRVNFDSPDNFRYKVPFSLFDAFVFAVLSAGGACVFTVLSAGGACRVFVDFPQVGVVGLLFIS